MGRSFQSIDSGPYYTCGLPGGRFHTCWGQAGLQGELTSPPVGSFVSVTTGGGHQCALEQDGDAILLGKPVRPRRLRPCRRAILEPHFRSSPYLRSAVGLYRDVLGLRPRRPSLPRPAVTVRPRRESRTHDTGPDETFTEVALRYYHSCALATDGTAYCWGENDHGQAAPPDNERFSSGSRRASRTAAVSGRRTAPRCAGAPTMMGGRHRSRSSVH